MDLKGNPLLRSPAEFLRRLIAKFRPLHWPLIFVTKVLHDGHLLTGRMAESLVSLVSTDETLHLRRRVRFLSNRKLLLELPVSLGAARELLFHNIYANPGEGTSYAVFAALAEEATCICDVGAHIGTYTYLAACASDRSTSHIVAFEPQPQLSALISRNIKLNALDHVRVEQKAVGQEPGRALLHMAAAKDFSSLDHDWAARSGISDTFPVNVTSLDEYFDESELPLPDLVKIDVEQAELSVLEGMAGIISRRRPDMIVELLGETRRSGLIDKAIREWGYDVYYVTTAIEKMPEDDGRFQQPYYNFLFTARTPEDIATLLPFSLTH